jgi:hypothetical protein
MADPHREPKITNQSTPSNDDDKELEALGYVPSFKREFSNLATVSPFRRTYLSAKIPLHIIYLRSLMTRSGNTQISFAFSIMCVRESYSYLCRVTPISCRSRRGLCSSIATTFNTPLLVGGPSSVRSSLRNLFLISPHIILRPIFYSPGLLSVAFLHP